MADQEFIFNGINGSRGTYLTPPLSPEAVSRLAQGEPLDSAHLAELKNRHRRETEMTFGTIQGVNPKDLASAGWGMIAPPDLPPGVLDALRRLLEHRRSQASRERAERYKEYVGYLGYRPNETKRLFLARQGAAAGMPADPDKVPYYLLLVGSPETIPYQFQYQLDVEYAVGRLWFERPDGSPDLEAFARYAESVVQVESGKVPPLPRRGALFGVKNPDDQATALSSDFLVRPLAQQMAGTAKGWNWSTHLQEQACKANLAALLGGPDTPALLFTASHGMGFDPDDTRLIPHQGALLCQEWPGPLSWGAKEIAADQYFAADDVPDAARVLGLVAFHFACYGLGTPRFDDFPHLKQISERETIAPRPFVARLPQRLLGHPKGGALAVIGHVERAWSTSFYGGMQLGSQLQAFQSAFGELLDGGPVGFAMEYFNQLYAALSTELSADLEDIRFGKIPDNVALSRAWTANNDARSYLVFGDPAVRLVVGDAAPSDARAALEGLAGFTAVATVSKSAEPQAETPASPAASEPPSGNEVTLMVPLQLPAGQDQGSSAPTVTPLRITVRVEPPLAVASTAAGATAPVRFETIRIDPDYGNREGYDPEFLGGEALSVPLPRLSASQIKAAARVEGTDPGEDPYELRYHHFSVVMNRVRRLAFFTAVNIDGRLSKPVERVRDKWIFDPRLGPEAQVGNELYGRPFDRGHLVRPLGPAWGRSARVARAANDDTFHFTNCSPQHFQFNEGKNLWAGLEDYLLDRAAGGRMRMTVFTGPVLDEDDPEYKGIRIPRHFWKIAVFGRPGGGLGALGFVVSQEALVRDFLSFGRDQEAQLFQTSIRQVEVMTGLSFGMLDSVDAGSLGSYPPEESPLRVRYSLEEITMF